VRGRGGTVAATAVAHRRLCCGGAALAAAALLGAGCGGGTRQDASEPTGDFQVQVLRASFPAQQHIAKQERLLVSVRNTGAHAIPDVAVTVDSFSQASQRTDLADPQRPVWIVDAGPYGGDTAYTNTWALGRLERGQTKTFVWRVTPVQAGTHTVRWRVAAGLNGKAKAVMSGDRAPAGSFTVDVSDRPARATVNPETGAVVRK
jgi:hypothetical protein